MSLLCPSSVAKISRNVGQCHCHIVCSQQMHIHYVYNTKNDDLISRSAGNCSSSVILKLVTTKQFLIITKIKPFKNGFLNYDQQV